MQKAREENGMGFPPYGYKLIEGELKIAEDEREVIELIYNKYATTNMGIGAVASYLNTNGYIKRKGRIIALTCFLIPL